ncbi:siderophore-interacting protein [Caulobacter sp. RL271]|uniref:Siderophore-interacting protein n=1 Tax=Caulobacter segnis TaxID=88688 RepID=A0ABY4ZSF5_9CAUL|nr:siderophore-interacting protein [Caulobacter segnis]USQ95319.1 siderophore-interacting protein [Caulobacter segnis]
MAKMTISLRPKPGPLARLSKALTSLVMKRATVVVVEPLAPDFRLITLEGPALAGATWTPGQKIQIAMGSAFAARTYTPIAWESSQGRTQLLGYAHGDGPGSAWLRTLKAGVECDLFGPRPSLDVAGLAGPVTVFGDETSMGLAHALSAQGGACTVSCVLEVGDVDHAKTVAARLGLKEAMLFERTPDDAHLKAVAAEFASRAAAGAAFVLTGRAGAIQKLRQGMMHQGVPSGRVAAKAYWAPGKVGLD